MQDSYPHLTSFYLSFPHFAGKLTVISDVDGEIEFEPDSMHIMALGMMSIYWMKTAFVHLKF